MSLSIIACISLLRSALSKVKPRCGILCADSSCSILDRELDTISTRKFDPFYLNEEGKKIFKEEVSDYWKNKCMLDRWRATTPEDMNTLRDNGMISGICKEAEDALFKLDDAHVGDLEKIAAVCRRVPEYPATSDLDLVTFRSYFVFISMVLLSLFQVTSAPVFSARNLTGTNVLPPTN